jgi:DNA-binding IclR family transcriptional regulator
METTVQVKTAGTVFQVVEALIRLEGATFPELVDHLDMAKSTVYDYIQTLEELGYVTRRDGAYHASLRFLEVGEQIRHHMDSYRVVRPEVDRLAEVTGEHSSFEVEENAGTVMLCSASGGDAVTMDAYDGNRTPMAVTAPGKLILAHKSDAEVADYVETHGLPAYTDESITDREELHRELEEIRRQGYALDDGEIRRGVTNVSVPVITRGDLRGALTVTGPTRRITDDRIQEELLVYLHESANVVELGLVNG